MTTRKYEASMKWTKDDSFLFIGAHPDDAEIKAGGLIALLRKDDVPVTILLSTYGFSCVYGDESWLTRMKEQDAAAQILDAKYEYFHYGDSDVLQATPANRKYLAGTIRRINPTVIITHRIYDYHPDHRITGQLVIDALPLLHKERYVTPGASPIERPTLYFFFDEMRPNFTTDVAIDIGEVMQIKQDAINAHVTQRVKYAEDAPTHEAEQMAQRARYAPFMQGRKENCSYLYAELFERYRY